MQGLKLNLSKRKREHPSTVKGCYNNSSVLHGQSCIEKPRGNQKFCFITARGWGAETIHGPDNEL